MTVTNCKITMASIVLLVGLGSSERSMVFMDASDSPDWRDSSAAVMRCCSMKYRKRFLKFTTISLLFAPILERWPPSF
jgi:hypothetical protein